MFEYTHQQRNDDSTLVYRVEACTNRVSGVWTNTGSRVLGANILGGVYDEVTNSISADRSQIYLRLKITTP